MKCLDFTAGLLIGALAGAVVSMLFAPQSGEETREKIMEFADDATGKVAENGRQLLESSRDMLEKGKTQVAGAIKTAGSTVKDVADTLADDVKHIPQPK